MKATRIYGFIFLAYLAAQCVIGQAALMTTSEYQIKAAYLYNFTQFVHWPAHVFDTDDSPFRLCILGEDPFGQYLEPLQARSVDGRQLVVEYPQSVTAARHCQVLFFAQSEKPSQIRKIIDTLQHQPILTVSEAEGFIDQRGMIRFVNVEDTVRIEVNLASATNASLTISAKLLEVCVRVIQDELAESNDATH